MVDCIYVPTIEDSRYYRRQGVVRRVDQEEDQEEDIYLSIQTALQDSRPTKTDQLYFWNNNPTIAHSSLLVESVSRIISLLLYCVSVPLYSWWKYDMFPRSFVAWSEDRYAEEMGPN